MALQDPQAEPSMEEILASIRRIISEEEQASAEVELDAPAPRSAQPSVADDIVLEAVEQVALPAPRLQGPAAEPAMLSPPTATATAGALARLAGTLRIADTQEQTIEGMVRELLKPMLKDWLDQNLQAIVEARVEAELERIARMAR
jgi:hypothetical protein